jgi:hypothetical protein
MRKEVRIVTAWAKGCEFRGVLGVELAAEAASCGGGVFEALADGSVLACDLRGKDEGASHETAHVEPDTVSEGV